MLSQLQWATLEQRRYITRLSIIFYKILCDHDFPVQIATTILPNNTVPYKTVPPKPLYLTSGLLANITQYQLSYFPRKIKNWNTLYPSVAIMKPLMHQPHLSAPSRPDSYKLWL